MKSIIIVSTQGPKRAIVESSATTWGELSKEISENYSISALKATIGETQNTLEERNAALPDTNFTLFLTPKATKSGVSL